MVRQATQSRAAREEKGERAEERGDRQTKCGVEGGEERARPGPDLELTRNPGPVRQVSVGCTPTRAGP
jgi:hypothetical protein